MDRLEANNDQHRKFSYMLGVVEAGLGKCSGILEQYAIITTRLSRLPVNLPEATLQLGVAENQEAPGLAVASAGGVRSCSEELGDGLVRYRV